MAGVMHYVDEMWMTLTAWHAQRRWSMKHARSLLFCLLFALSWTALATPVDASRQPHVVAGLGSIDFPTSTRSQAAQAAFDRGTLLLHLFEYANAAAAFREAQRLDPGYAMAYWGEAMSYNHGIWNQLDETAGRAALAVAAARTQDGLDRAVGTAVVRDDQGSRAQWRARFRCADQACQRGQAGVVGVGAGRGACAGAGGA